ncbi:MAG TPA: hypothetical protein VNA69_16110 [Thermoanaerobaculia bacterium]|nr:hypothetical protein [Thermoanaerobaculia bacterium]
MKKNVAAEGYAEVSDKIGQLKMTALNGMQRLARRSPSSHPVAPNVIVNPALLLSGPLATSRLSVDGQVSRIFRRVPAVCAIDL